MRITWFLLLFFIPEYGAVKLLMSVTKRIKIFEESDTTSETSLISSTHMMIAVDYHLARGEFYYTDSTGWIFRNRLRAEERVGGPQVIAEVNVADGIAVDWVHDNLYWTDVERQTLEVATLDGFHRRILFNATHGLQKPRAIVLDPSRGILFWSDWGDNARVESAGLDGKNVETVASANILWPNGLTIDLSNSKLYILDGYLSTISSCNYDGSDFKVISRSEQQFLQAFGLTFYADNLFWNSWRSHTLFKMNTINGRTETLLSQTGLIGVKERMMGLKAVHASLQPKPSKSDPCMTSACSHWCLLSRDLTPTCLCPFGFKLATDGNTCIEEGYLLVSWRKAINRYSIDGNEEEWLTNDTSAAIAIGYHLEKGFVFWSDVEEHRIYRAPLDQLNNRTVIANPIVCDGLAVDWIHDVLYWTDTEKKTLEAAQLDGSKHMVIFDNDLDQPRDVALDPFLGLMFWTDWGASPKLEQSTLNGLERKTIIDDNHVWPNGITIDIPLKKIYYVDGKLGTIYSCSYDGSDRKIIFSPTTFLTLQLFSITLLNDELYCTDWYSRAVLKSPKYEVIGVSDITIVRNARASTSIFVRPNGIKAVHSSLQQRTKNNPCAAAGCHNLCLGTKDNGAYCAGEVPDIDVRTGSTTETQKSTTTETPKSTTTENPKSTTTENPKSTTTETPKSTESPKTTQPPELVKTAFNDSIDISFTKPLTPGVVIITVTCIGREGCEEDSRCRDQTRQSYRFHRRYPYHVYGLLPASHYEIVFESEELDETFNITTTLSDPPEIPKITSVEKQGQKLTIKWESVDTCVPNFSHYHYKLFKTAVENDEAQEGRTNLTEVAFENLEPEVSYTIQVYTSDPKHFSSKSFNLEREVPPECPHINDINLLCNGNEDCPDGSDEDVKRCAGIENVIVYRKSKSDVNFRVEVTNDTKKQLDKFVGSYSSEKSNITSQFERTAETCVMWPESYCFHIPSLQDNTIYNFKIAAALKSGKVGNKFTVSTITKEEASGPPEDIGVIKHNATCLVYQWHYPNESNGIIKNFIINIEETETFEEDKCCQSFPMIELPVSGEEPLYETATTGLIPASSYAISVAAKNIYLGTPIVIVANTPPPPMEIVRMPRVEVASLLPLSWQPGEEPGELPQYHVLIRAYMLLLLPQKKESLNDADNYGTEAVKHLLQARFGDKFVILWDKKVEETEAFRSPINVKNLPAHKRYKLAWVQVSQYKDSYSIDVLESDPFITV